MMTQCMLYFDVQPAHNHLIFYGSDKQKDKILSGRNEKYPVIIVKDSKRRNGNLLVTCVDAEGLEIDGGTKYRLHRHKLIDFKNKSKYCDNYGVASYRLDYDDRNEAKVLLQNLSVRSTSEKLMDLERKWQKSDNKFDPFGIGYGYVKSTNNLKVIDEFAKKALDLNYFRLCCKIVFDDKSESPLPIVSDIIENCSGSIQVYKWVDGIKVSANGGDLIYVCVKKLKKPHRKIFAVFYDNEDCDSKQYRCVYPDYIHAYNTIRFSVPPARANEDTKLNLGLIKTKFYLAVENKPYKSKIMYFNYIYDCICEHSVFKQPTFTNTSNDYLEDVGKTLLKKRNRTTVQTLKSNKKFKSIDYVNNEGKNHEFDAILSQQVTNNIIENEISHSQIPATINIESEQNNNFVYSFENEEMVYQNQDQNVYKEISFHNSANTPNVLHLNLDVGNELDINQFCLNQNEDKFSLCDLNYQEIAEILSE